MVEVTSPIVDSYVVHAERPGWGKTPSSAVGVYHYRRINVWDCEQCRSAYKTTRPDCFHIKFVKELLDAAEETHLA